MKKTWIMLLVVAMVGALLAMPGTALAKGKPPKPPTGALYDVTLVGDLATTSACSQDEPATSHLVMQGTLNGTTLNLVADGTEGTSIPRLELDTSMTGKRTFPSEPVAFTGCHGGSPYAGSLGSYGGTVVNHAGLLMIAIDGDAITFNVWHFDYWWEETSVTHGKKTTSAIDVVENFRMSADTVTMGDWDGVTGSVSGAFGIDHFLNDSHTGDYIGSEPATGSPDALAFTITIAPAG